MTTAARHRRLAAAVLAGALAVLTACTAQPDTPQLPMGAASPPMPVGVQDPAVVPADDGGGEDCSNARESLRPKNGTAIPDGSTMAKIRSNGKLVVGVDQNTYLFGYRDPTSNRLSGFDVEIAREIAEAIFGDPDKIQFKAISSGQRIPFVESGEVDMVVRTMTMTCERWNKVHFSQEYFTAEQRILTRRDPADPDKTVETLAELAGKRVCAAIGSTSIRVIAAEPAAPVPVAVPEWTDCLVMLQQGTVDAISTDNTILAGFAAQDPQLIVSTTSLHEEPYGIAINTEHDDLVRFVNAVLNRMIADGTWAAVYANPTDPGGETAGPSLVDILGPAEPPTPRYRD